MTTTDRSYYDYLEMEAAPTDGATATTSSGGGRVRSWLVALATTVLLLGSASVAYTTVQSKQLSTAPLSTALVATSTEPLLADEAVVVTGNRVALIFPFGLVKDGLITTAIISVLAPYRSNPPPAVQVSAPGLRLARTKFTFDPRVPASLDQRVACRTESSAVHSKTGTVSAMTVTFTFPSANIAAEKQPVQRELVSAGRCSAWGDPHLTSFDGVAFDFQPAGVYRYVQSRNFQMHVFQEKCPPGRSGPSAPSCYQGVAIAFADSIIRLYLANNTIHLAKGSEDLRWFDIVKFGGNTEGYRVFTNADQSSYIDVTMGIWVNNYAYLNIAFQASAFFRDPNITGLMGNWNGNPADDVRDTKQLVAAYGLPLDDNLFTCASETCTTFLQPASEDDELTLLVPIDVPNLRNGFTAVDSTKIAVETYKPVPRAVLLSQDYGDEDEEPVVDVTRRALELCDQVISEITTCDKYVPNTSFFIYNVCLVDSVTVGDLTVVENTKLGYLRECRRELENRIEAAAANPEELAELVADREALEFGDLRKCPEDCNGNGDCLAAGCHCHHGFTGYSCVIEI